MKNERVTIHQAKLVRQLGFNEKCTAFLWKWPDDKVCIYETAIVSVNSKMSLASVPTVDQVIDWLRKKYNIIVYHTHIPYVCPKTHKIVYTFTPKICNPIWGWNQRITLKRGIQSRNIYAAKRSAITIALNWILSQKSEKSKNNKKLSKHGCKSKSNQRSKTQKR